MTPAQSVAPATTPRLRAVEGGRINYLSVSQLNKYDRTEYGGCPRRWAGQYVYGWPKEPETEAQREGVDGHARLEAYLKGGPDALSVGERKALPHLPPPGVGLVEWALNDTPAPKDEAGKAISFHAPAGSLVRLGDVPLVGFMDLVVPPTDKWHRVGNGDAYTGTWTARVIDHKYTGSVARMDGSNAGTSEHPALAPSIAVGAQLTGYGMFVHAKWPHVTHVSLEHHYHGMGKAAGRFLPLARVETVETIVNRWERKFAPMAREMADVAKTTPDDFLHLPSNPDACFAYGKPCPYAAGGVHKMCPTNMRAMAQQLQQVSASPTTAREGKPDMSALLDSIKAKKAAATAASTPATAAPKVAPPAAPHAPAKVATPAPVAKPAPRPALPIVDESTPDEVETEPEVKVTGDIPEGMVQASQLEAGQFVAAYHPDGSVAAVQEGGTDPGIAPPAPPVEAPKPVAAKPPRAKAAPKAPAARWGGELPAGFQGGTASPLNVYVAGLLSALATEGGVADIRATPKEHSFAYGAWRGALASLTIAQPPAPGTYTASSSSETDMIAVDALSGAKPGEYEFLVDCVRLPGGVVRAVR